jgi:hypothetical protein
MIVEIRLPHQGSHKISPLKLFTNIDQRLSLKLRIAKLVVFQPNAIAYGHILPAAIKIPYVLYYIK